MQASDFISVILGVPLPFDDDDRVSREGIDDIVTNNGAMISTCRSIMFTLGNVVRSLRKPRVFNTTPVPVNRMFTASGRPNNTVIVPMMCLFNKEANGKQPVLIINAKICIQDNSKDKQPSIQFLNGDLHYLEAAGDKDVPLTGLTSSSADASTGEPATPAASSSSSSSTSSTWAQTLPAIPDEEEETEEGTADRPIRVSSGEEEEGADRDEEALRALRAAPALREQDPEMYEHRLSAAAAAVL